MKNRKVILSVLGICLFALSVVGLSYAYWILYLSQTKENLVYTDCLDLEADWGPSGFNLENAYPMTNEELETDLFPNTNPYHFKITNKCDSSVDVTINLESLNVGAEDHRLKDDYVDVILWEGQSEEKFNVGSTEILSNVNDSVESKYRLIDNVINNNKLINDSLQAYRLVKNVTIPQKETKEYNLLLFLDYETPVSTPDDVTNNAKWKGKITLTNYQKIPTVILGEKEMEVVEEGNGLYIVNHVTENMVHEGYTEEQLKGFQQSELRYAGPNPNNYVWFNSDPGCTKEGNFEEQHCELWRIIGLVNVLVPQADGSNQVEQRIKLIRNEFIMNANFFSSDYNINGGLGVNEWSKSYVKTQLNGDYYNSFDSYENNGLKENSKKMIDENTVWNTGAAVSGNVRNFYIYERSHFTGDLCKIEKGGEGGNLCNDEIARITEWSKESDPDEYHGIGLMYPSDYGYATSGSQTGTRREQCLAKEMHNWDDYSDCANNDWLNLNSEVWTLTSEASNTAYYIFMVYEYGEVQETMANSHREILPVVYLESNVVISGGNGTKGASAYTLSVFE